MRDPLPKIFLFVFLFLSQSASLFADPSPFKNSVAVTPHPLATEAALEMYRRGGNAVDAAVAAAFALGVVEPQNSGIGGGGFMMVYLVGKKQVIALDYREIAPALASPEIFRDRSSTKGLAAVAVPGEIRGLAEALRSYGRLSLQEVLSPAIRLAAEGFRVTPLLAERLKARGDCLNEFEAARKIFFPGGKMLGEGERLVQGDLARTLRRISEKGPDDFYQGEIAGKIDVEMKKGQGLIRGEDLKGYQVKKRAPLKISYRGYDLYLMPLPSSGGIVMAEMFQMLSQDPLGSLPWGTLKEAHLLAETMKLAFYDRSRFLGDGDFVSVPQDRLLSPVYAKEQRRRISFGKRIMDLAPGPKAMEGDHTTHATFADREGNVVSMTNTLNLSFGSCVVIPGTGILLNNEMDDFETRPGQPNAFGLVQGLANGVAPGKRPLSSMSPTLVFKDGRPVFALGSPGGPTIITNVFQVLINLLDHRMGLEEAVARPKIHHQYLPDVVRYEKGYPDTTLRGLERWGHSLKSSEKWGNIQALHMDGDSRTILGVADPRGEGVAGNLLSE